VANNKRSKSEAPGPRGSGASNLDKEVNVVKCDICDQEFANSEEVKRHKEQVHPMGEDEGEKPDLMETPGMNGMEPDSSEMPETAEQRNR
jgi:hypothetical protein